ncbi:M23 family metallopeptidase [Gordoniibacillus kamchatkensis]|uniref:M23 family metallopeptidase n=1 Tax=Gordoniibacillus kamchatkensis TaxID=1590651 RepID=UPI000695E8B7|nr:M23 family metallopeptidase [Paenibacillus sp. VKM B-2647]
METKHNVKQRRAERLKRLQAERGVEYEAERVRGENGPYPSAPEQPRQALPSAELPSQSGNWSDPEYAWKHRFERSPGYAAAPSDEQLHGQKPPTARRLVLRLIVSAALFGAVWTMFRLPQSWAQTGRQLVTAALTEPMNMERLAVWYESKFRGAPSVLPSFHRSGDDSVKASSGGKRTYFAPAKGVVASPFAGGKQGVLLQTKADAPVYAMDTGLVTYAGKREGTGFTVVIRHPNGVQTVYGEVEDCKLEVNDWIKGGEAIGKAGRDGDGGKLYFAVQKDGRYVNPADVVAIVP